MSATPESQLTVVKRDGSVVEVSFDAILNRLKCLGEPKNLSVNYGRIVMKVIDQMHDGMHTSAIDELTAQQCAAMSTVHPDYDELASRLITSNLHKNTPDTFSAAAERLFSAKDVGGRSTPLISDSLIQTIRSNADAIDKMVVTERDMLIDYFGFKTLERAYLYRVNGSVVERPQYMWLRVALGIHGEDLVSAKETYDLMSTLKLTHATPTLFNAGSPRPQLSSCYLVAMESDSIDGIYNTVHECATISKWAGGIGCHIHDIRATGSQIRGTNGTSNGIVPMLKVFNSTARYVDQGGGKRNGSIAVYLEPWHADIDSFLDLKKNHGDEESRARDLFYALWIPDLFMERVVNEADWSLFCPDQAPGLSDCFGSEFVELYTKYEREGLALRTVKARDLWLKIMDAQMETGVPYLLYKDAANRKSNQQNVGTIKSSNLCCEIMEYSSPDETAVCNLASLGLPKFINEGVFDFEALGDAVRVLTRNLNKVIDINYYPTPKAEKSNRRHRPIGIGVQGLADVFAILKMPYDSQEARVLNLQIFETIYYYSCLTSCKISQERGMREDIIRARNGKGLVQGLPDDVIAEELTLPSKWAGAYSSFDGSPASKGLFQFDMWDHSDIWSESTSRYDWHSLGVKIRENGMRNSLLVAPMPTASTAQILGNNECFEPFTSHIYTRRTAAGDFVQINRHLVNELVNLNLWTKSIKEKIILGRGSVQAIDEIPYEVRLRYKTVWEIPMRHLIDLAVDRGRFVCQSQSLNLWKEDPDYRTLTSMHMYAWRKGLKTGMYYLRRKPRAHAQQFTVDPSIECTSCSG